MNAVIEYTRNPDYLIIHTNFPLTEKRHESYGEFSFSGDLPAPFVAELLNEPGITSITLRKYECSLKKGRVFIWESLLPRVLAILGTLDSKAVIIDYTDKSELVAPPKDTYYDEELRARQLDKTLNEEA